MGACQISKTGLADPCMVMRPVAFLRGGNSMRIDVKSDAGMNLVCAMNLGIACHMRAVLMRAVPGLDFARRCGRRDRAARNEGEHGDNREREAQESGDTITHVP
ncbi:MAG: hypothetical protein ACK5JM_02515 [Rhodoblastus sp.]